MKTQPKILLRFKRLVHLVIIGFVIIGGIQLSPAFATPVATTHTVCSSGCDYTTIQAAVNAADHGDTIQLLITTPHTENDIVVNKSVTMDGLGELNTTIQAAGSPGTASNRVFFILDGLNVHFRDMTIKNGKTNSTGGGLHNAGSDVTLTNINFLGNEASDGGAIYSAGGTLTLTNILVANNSIFNDGGGVYNAGTLLIENSTVNNNENRRRGAGIFNSGVATIRNSDIGFNDVLLTSGFNAQGGGIYNEGTLHVFNSTIHFNQMAGATSASSSIGGGGIYSSGGELQLHGSIVEQNSVGSEQKGGGLYLSGGETTISHSIINNNQASGAFASTGGLHMTSGTLTMRDTTVRDNLGDLVGGGLHLTNGSVGISRTTISGNEAVFGGGVYVCGNQGTMAFSNSTISDNEVTSDGGGIYVCPSGELHLANVTVSDNRADSDDEGNGDGGGIYLHTFNQDSGIIHLKNTILGDNDDLSDWPGTLAHDCFGQVTSEGYNLISDLGSVFMGSPPCTLDGDPTGNLIGEPALLDILADNGGPTQTHAFLPGSPALNTGDPAGCTDVNDNPLLTDQRGGLRPDRCDKGAFEFGALIEHNYLPTVQK
jgi:parallel beta-helix repeat protein/predicted outer membrane repeat protein